MIRHPLAAGTLLLGSATLFAALPADSQEHAPPACAEGGIQRLATTIPPGTTREELVAALEQSGALTPGTQVRLLSDEERPPLTNPEHVNARFRMHIGRMLDSGLEVNGEAVVLLGVDADGRVTSVQAATGHRELDRQLRLLWLQARFEPMVVGSCRVPVYLHARLDFRFEYRHWTRKMEVRTVN